MNSQSPVASRRSPVLSFENITRIYEQGGSRLEVLRNLNMVIHAGEIVALVGPSGSGKTTLLQIAGLLDSPSSGDVIVAGQTMASANDKTRTAFRLGKIGFVYQFHYLLPEFSALENVMLPQMIAGISSAAASKKAEGLLTRLGLEGRLSYRPAKLSGGEQQRVAIARALVNDPVLLLADEPTGNLDEHTAESVFNLLIQVMKERQLAALVATHNMSLASRMTRTARLKDGRVE